MLQDLFLKEKGVALEERLYASCGDMRLTAGQVCGTDQSQSCTKLGQNVVHWCVRLK